MGIPRGRCALLIAAAGVVAVAIAPLSSQTKQLPESPGVWKPWKGLTAVASTRAEAGVTAAQAPAAPPV